MSDEQIRFKHSKRLQKRDNAIKKQVKIARENHMIEPGKFLEKAHRYHKRHAMDCGNPECYLCGNPRRTHKDRLTPQEKSLFQDLDNVRDTHSNGLKNDEKDLL